MRDCPDIEIHHAGSGFYTVSHRPTGKLLGSGRVEGSRVEFRTVRAMEATVSHGPSLGWSTVTRQVVYSFPMRPESIALFLSAVRQETGL
jgi:hypothetical protein